MPIEKEKKLSRKLLEIILRHRFPVEVATKSRLVLRDLDLLKQIDKVAILPDDLKGILRGGTIVSHSISTLDEKLAKIFEPGAPLPIERLDTIRECKKEELFAGVNIMPMLPFLSDSYQYPYLYLTCFKLEDRRLIIFEPLSKLVFTTLLL